jgi:hypothetical protein
MSFRPLLAHLAQRHQLVRDGVQLLQRAAVLLQEADDRAVDVVHGRRLATAGSQLGAMLT